MSASLSVSVASSAAQLPTITPGPAPTGPLSRLSSMVGIRMRRWSNILGIYGINGIKRLRGCKVRQHIRVTVYRAMYTWLETSHQTRTAKSVPTLRYQPWCSSAQRIASSACGHRVWPSVAVTPPPAARLAQRCCWRGLFTGAASPP